MGLSIFALILIAAVVIGIGMGALALLAMVIKALTGRGRLNSTAQVGAWSGLKSALGISAGLIALLLAVGALTLARSHHSFRSASASEQAIVIQTTSAEDVTIRQSVLNPSDVGPGSAKPAIEVSVDVNDGSTVTIGVDSSGTPKDQSHPSQDASSSVTVADPNETDAAVQRKVQLEKIVAGIGKFLRSQLEKVGEKSNSTAFGQAAKSDNGDVVIFQPSEEMVQQILGAGGQDLLKSFNSELPGRIRQTYALIPLTPPVGSTVPMQPMIATGGLEMIANSIVSIVEHAESTTSTVPPESVALTAEADGTLTVAPELRPEPEWMSRTEGRRIIAKTEPMFPGDDPMLKLTEAINKALAKHVESVAAGMNPAMLGQAKYVHMQLPPAIASKYIVDRYERPASMETEIGGKTSFKLLYALVEFPDTIDQIAVRQIRQSVQRDRIIGLAVIVGLIWLSVCSAGFGVRQWQKGTKLCRMAATPVFAVITIPTLLLTVAMVFALAKGDVPRGPWNETPVTIDLADMQGV